MGRPHNTEAYKLDDGKQIEFWFYRTRPRVYNSEDIDRNFTPVTFEDGKVIGWGYKH